MHCLQDLVPNMNAAHQTKDMQTQSTRSASLRLCADARLDASRPGGPVQGLQARSAPTVQ